MRQWARSYSTPFENKPQPLESSTPFENKPLESSPFENKPLESKKEVRWVPL